jgi:hypothetical protein
MPPSATAKPIPPTCALAHELLPLGVVARVRVGPLVYTTWDRGATWRAATSDGYDRAVAAACATDAPNTVVDEAVAQRNRRTKYASMTSPSKAPRGVVIPEGLFP